jgi:hypothetical protein
MAALRRARNQRQPARPQCSRPRGKDAHERAFDIRNGDTVKVKTQVQREMMVARAAFAARLSPE